MSGTLLLCTNCGKDPQEEGSNWCIACLMYVEPPLDNDELMRVRSLLLRPRRTALSMLVFGRRFGSRGIREANGDTDWLTDVRCGVWRIRQVVRRGPWRAAGEGRP